jgi:hypothetical protein
MFQLEGLDKYKKIANDIRLPLLLNLAACKLHNKEWHDVIALCSGVRPCSVYCSILRVLPAPVDTNDMST